jgi:hypothetical protein
MLRFVVVSPSGTVTRSVHVKGPETRAAAIAQRALKGFGVRHPDSKRTRKARRQARDRARCRVDFKLHFVFHGETTENQGVSNLRQPIDVTWAQI